MPGDPFSLLSWQAALFRGKARQSKPMPESKMSNLQVFDWPGILRDLASPPLTENMTAHAHHTNYRAVLEKEKAEKEDQV